MKVSRLVAQGGGWVDDEGVPSTGTGRRGGLMMKVSRLLAQGGGEG